MLLIILCLQYRLWVGEGSFAQVFAIEQEIAVQQAKNKELLLRNEKLYAEVLELREAQSAIEESARNQLGMIYPDERFFWLIESDQP